MAVPEHDISIYGLCNLCIMSLTAPRSMKAFFLIILLVLSLGATVSIIGTADEGGSPIEPARRGTRATGLDVNLTINSHEDKQEYPTTHGVLVNATLANAGTVNVTGDVNLTLTIYDIRNGKDVYTTTRKVTDLGEPGNFTYVIFTNWTLSYIANFTMKVEAELAGDVYLANNTVELNFTMVDPNPGPISLSNPKVEPKKGSTETMFNFSVRYIHTFLPVMLKLELDEVQYDLVEANGSDLNPADGKDYYIKMKIPVLGAHSFRFNASTGDINATSPLLDDPWINLTLKDPTVTPSNGYITAGCNFTVTYGDYSNDPPLSIKVVVDDIMEFNMTPINHLDNVYQDANNVFFAYVKGIVLDVGPHDWRIEVVNANDVFSTETFTMEGPKPDQATIQGTVYNWYTQETIAGASIELPTLNRETLTDDLGHFSFQVPVGYGYYLITNADGFYTWSNPKFDLPNKGDSIDLSINLTPLPEGGSIQGYLYDGYSSAPLENANVSLEDVEGKMTYAMTDATGMYEFEAVPSGTYDLWCNALNHVTVRKKNIGVTEGSVIWLNVTMPEAPFPLTVKPAPDATNIDVTDPLLITFDDDIDNSTLVVYLYRVIGTTKTPVPVTISYDNYTYTAQVTPTSALFYSSSYEYNIPTSVLSSGGQPLLWRNYTGQFETTYKKVELKTFVPSNMAENVRINTTISFTVDVDLLNNSVKMRVLKVSTEVTGTTSMVKDYDTVTEITTTTVTFTPTSELENAQLYTVVLDLNITDVYGHKIFDEEKSWRFFTIKRIDSDDDGVADADDPFPNDPSEWADTDSDGIGDNSDDFPLDRAAHSDLDGDGRPDTLNGTSTTGLTADDDIDGDGLPNSWEDQYGLDSYDPTDANLDPDGDGFTNYQEYKEETDPSDSGSKPSSASSDDNTMYILAAILVVILVVAIIGFGVFAVMNRKSPGPAEEERELLHEEDEDEFDDDEDEFDEEEEEDLDEEELDDEDEEELDEDEEELEEEEEVEDEDEEEVDEDEFDDEEEEE